MQTKEEIISQLTIIFRKVLDDPSIELNETTNANDIERWDSLNHIRLLVAAEKHFKIKFTSKEMRGWKNIGDLATNIFMKLSQQEVK